MADDILTKDRNGADIAIAAKDRGGVLFPRNGLTNAAGVDIDPATEATLVALNGIAAAVQAAVEALNAKVTSVNTGAIAGTVALDAPSLAALETVNIAGTVPVSAASLPLPSGAATQATLASIQSAIDALNAKVTAANTGAVAVVSAPTTAVTGTFWQATQPVSFTWAGLTDAQLRATPVPVSGTFWQATQPVSFTWQGLTDAQLRAAAVPVSAAALPLPAGASTEATLATLSGKIPALDAGRLPVVLPPGGSGLTDSELRAAAVPVDVAGELVEAIQALRMTVHSLSRSIGMLVPDASGRMRAITETGSTVSVSALPTLAAVTTVTTLTTLANQTNVGGFAANDYIPALMRIGAEGLRRNISVS